MNLERYKLTRRGVTLWLLTLLAAVTSAVTGYAQRPLGVFTLGAQNTGTYCGQPHLCPTGATVYAFKVECPGIAVTRISGQGEIAIRVPTGTVTSVDVFMSGHGGQRFWDTDAAAQMFDNLVAQGHEIVQIRWKNNGWFAAPSGVQYGFELQACRPATAIKWVHDNISAPLGAKLQVVGSSAGSTQITYAMSSY